MAATVEPLPSIRQPSLAMSKQELDALPFLVSRKQFLAVSGLGWRRFAALVESGAVRRWTAPGGHYGRYYREDLCRLASVPTGKSSQLSPTPKAGLPD